MTTLRLNLDGTQHIYNPRYQTFHVTLQHLYGVQAYINDLKQMGSLSIELRNPDTGNAVEFSLTGRGPCCALYTALYNATGYWLMVWTDIETLRSRYTRDLDLYAMWRKSPELELSPIYPPIPTQQWSAL